MSGHPNNLVNVMKLIGYSLADMMPAYPGKDEAYLDGLLRDNALALSRPVMPYGLLGIHPCRSRCFNVEEGGFRSNGTPQPWPPDCNKTNIFFFGGSTAVGFNIEDSQTIPACLQRFLDRMDGRCAVYNFGSGSYTSRHEALRFLELIDRGHVPDHAIFLSGLNDSFYAFGNYALVHTLDVLYQTEKKRRRMSYLGSLVDFAVSSFRERRRPLPSSQTYAPESEDKELAQGLSEASIQAALHASHRQLKAEELTDFHVRVARRAWAHYLDSVALIRSIARRRGVRVLFVWQPVAYFKTTEAQRVMERLYLFYRHEILSHLVYNWLHLFGFSEMQDNPEFHNLSGVGEKLEGKLYVDICHYSSIFCEVISEAIAEKLLDRTA